MMKLKSVEFLRRPLVPVACFAILTLMSGPPSRTSKLGMAAASAAELDTINRASKLGMAAASAAELDTINRAARDFKLPEQIPWSKRAGNGAQTAILFGDPSKPGIYVQLSRRARNNWSRPHFHDNDRFITVLEGTMWIGTGTKFDPDATVALHPGGFVRDIAKQAHFDGSKDDGFTIEIVGMGPATSTPAETK
jgi:hypothetical protein